MTVVNTPEKGQPTGQIDPQNEFKFKVNDLDPAKFDYEGGMLQFMDGFTNPNKADRATLIVPDATGVTVDNLATTSGTFLYFNRDGTLNQQSELRGGEFLRDHVAVAIIQHGSNTQIDDISNFTQVAIPNLAMGFADLSFAMGNVNTTDGDRNKISGRAGTSKVFKASGSFFFHAINADDATEGNKNPNIIESPEDNGDFMLTGWSITDVAEGKFIPSSTGMEFGIFDDGTAVFADALPQGVVGDQEWVNNRILNVADSKIQAMLYGNTVYPSAAAARLGIAQENFDIVPVFQAIVAMGVFTMRGGGTDNGLINDMVETQAVEVRAGYV